MGFNLGNYLNDNVFDKMKPVTGFIGSIANTGLNLFQGLSQNFLKIGQGVGNLLNSSFLLPVLLIGSGLFIMIRLKIIR